MKLSRKLAVAVSYLCVAGIGVVSAHVVERNRLVSQAVEDSKLASYMVNPSVEYSRDWHERYNLPRALHRKDLVVLYLLVRAAGAQEERKTGACYALGIFLFGKDCETATYYLRAHLQAVPDDEEVARLVERIEVEGCNTASSGSLNREAETAPATSGG